MVDKLYNNASDRPGNINNHLIPIHIQYTDEDTPHYEVTSDINLRLRLSSVLRLRSVTKVEIGGPFDYVQSSIINANRYKIIFRVYLIQIFERNISEIYTNYSFELNRFEKPS